MISVLPITAPIGKPPPMDFAHVEMSGTTPKCSQADQPPVLQKPDCTLIKDEENSRLITDFAEPLQISFRTRSESALDLHGFHDHCSNLFCGSGIDGTFTKAVELLFNTGCFVLAFAGMIIIWKRQPKVAGGFVNRKLQVLHETYAPGGDTVPEMMTHDGEEAGVIVRGKIELTVGGQCEVLGAGDAYYFNSRLPLRFRNIHKEECEIVSTCTPPTF